MISTVGTGISGVKLHDILRGKYHLEMEMEAENYVIALTGVLDNKEKFERLTQAFLEIDAGLSRSFEPKFCFEDSSRSVSCRAGLSYLWGDGRKKTESIIFRK